MKFLCFVTKSDMSSQKASLIPKNSDKTPPKMRKKMRILKKMLKLPSLDSHTFALESNALESKNLATTQSHLQTPPKSQAESHI